MSYTRSLESGHYIYPSVDGTVNFDGIDIEDEAVDIFIYKLFKNRKKEFYQRYKHGKQIIQQHKIS